MYALACDRCGYQSILLRDANPRRRLSGWRNGPRVTPHFSSQFFHDLCPACVNDGYRIDQAGRIFHAITQRSEKGKYAYEQAAAQEGR